MIRTRRDLGAPQATSTGTEEVPAAHAASHSLEEAAGPDEARRRELNATTRASVGRFFIAFQEQINLGHNGLRWFSESATHRGGAPMNAVSSSLSSPSAMPGAKSIWWLSASRAARRAHSRRRSRAAFATTPGEVWKSSSTRGSRLRS